MSPLIVPICSSRSAPRVACGLRHVQLAHRLARRGAEVQVDARPACDADLDVARDRAHRRRTRRDGSDLDVAGDRRELDRAADRPQRHLARRGLARDGAADVADARVTRCGDEREPAADVAADHVAARHLRVDVAVDVVEPDVARAAAEVQRSDPARDLEIGRARVARHERAERHRHVHAQLVPAPAEPLAPLLVLDRQTLLVGARIVEHDPDVVGVAFPADGDLGRRGLLGA